MAPNHLFGPDTMNAPWGLASRFKFVTLACDFFDANKIAVNHARVGNSLGLKCNPIAY